MKLATYKDGSRDGQLVVVARDLSTAHYATGIATRLQQVLDDWRFMAPQLQDLSDQLNGGKARHAFPFEPASCMAPLPRACQWVSGGAFPSHAERLRQGAAFMIAKAPPNPGAGPVMRQGAGDGFIGPCDAVLAGPHAASGIDFEAQLAAIVGDVPRGASPEEALGAVRLLMLANEVSLRGLPLAGVEETAGGGASLATAFSPVAITPDEVEGAWRQGRLHLTLQTTWRGRKVGLCDAGADMDFHFGQLIAHLCRHRSLGAGSIVGTGAVSHRDWAQGYHCIAEKRAMELIDGSKAATAFMQFGDTLRIEAKGSNGQSVFGAIDQAIAPAP